MKDIDFIKLLLTKDQLNAIQIMNLDHFDSIQKECLDIINTKPATTVLSDKRDYYSQDDEIIFAKDHTKLYDQLVGGYRSYQMFRPEPGWADQYGILKEEYQYQDWKFWFQEEYPYLANLLKTLPSCCNFCIGGLLPKSRLIVHRESTVKYFKNQPTMICRFHVPLMTNNDCYNYIGKGYFHLNEGVVYFFNIGSAHDGQNNSEYPRYHLSFDLILTENVLKMLKNGSILNPFEEITLPINPNRDVKNSVLLEDQEGSKIKLWSDNLFIGYI
jgi:hypothetical protein